MQVERPRTRGTAGLAAAAAAALLSSHSKCQYGAPEVGPGNVICIHTYVHSSSPARPPRFFPPFFCCPWCSPFLLHVDIHPKKFFFSLFRFSFLSFCFSMFRFPFSFPRPFLPDLGVSRPARGSKENPAGICTISPSYTSICRQAVGYSVSYSVLRILEMCPGSAAAGGFYPAKARHGTVSPV